MSIDLRIKTFKSMVGRTILDRYELQDLLGFGGMGAVFKGLQVAVNRPVAIKLLPKLDPLTAARFHREAKTASKLAHPNTITVFDFGTTQEGFLFLVMEYLEGRTLGNILKEVGPLPPRRAVHISNQICRSLSEAHAAGIVHRDIKPDNIFLINRNDDPDFIKVLDFGIAKVMAGDDPDDDLTQQGRIVGTPRYMAPEQVLGLTVDHRADIYSLGCILYQMLTGKPPFDDSSTAMLMMKHAHEQPSEFMYRMAQASAEVIPPGLEAVVMKALNKRPEARQQTVDMLRTALELVMPTTGSVYTPPEMAQSAPHGAMEAIAASGAWQSQHRPSGAWPQQPSSPRTPSPDDPSSPSHPSLSHPALMPHPGLPSGGWPRQTPMPHQAQVPSGAWAVSVNPHAVSGQQPAMTPIGTTAPMAVSGAHPPMNVSGAHPPMNTPNPAYTPGPSDSDVQWPPPGENKGNGKLFGIVALVLLLLIGAGATFYILSGDPEAPQTHPNAAAAQDTNNLPSTIRLTIQSTPSGAIILANGDKPIGETPTVIEVRKDLTDVQYTLRLEGHQSVTRNFTVADLPEGGYNWQVEMVKAQPVADKAEPPKEEDPQEDTKPGNDNADEASAAANKTIPKVRNRNPRNRQPRKAPKEDTTPVAQDPPPADPPKEAPQKPVENPAAAAQTDAKEPKAETKPVKKDTKPNVPTLDGGKGTKKPNVPTLDGGGSKKPNVPTLDGGGGSKKPNVPTLQ